MIGPSDPRYEAARIFERFAEIEARCKRLEQAPRVSVERAQVTTLGGAMVTVTYPTGTVRSVPYLGASPAVNDQVLILNSPAWSGVVGKVSA